MRAELIAQGGPQGLSVVAALADALRGRGYDRLDVAAAYATGGGVELLLKVLDTAPVISCWLIGLDDAVTQPAALDRVRALPGATLRVAQFTPWRRFHPKVYCFRKAADLAQAVCLIGSGNLTERGLQDNVEAATLLIAESDADAHQFKLLFRELWRVGHAPDAAELQRYSDAAVAAAAARRAAAAAAAAKGQATPPTDTRGEPPADDAATRYLLTGDRPPERVLATCVARIAGEQPDGRCTFAMAYDRIPRMIVLPDADLADGRWRQRVRNIKSNNAGGAHSTNFIDLGYLEHEPGIGFRITVAGRAMLRQRGYSAAIA